MELTGKIIAALDERSGTSARTGTEWRVASYVLETSEQYPRKMCFDVFGSDRIQTMNIRLGETMTVKFDIDAHEYNGRWYNSIRAYAVSRDTAAPAAGQMPYDPAPQPQQPAASPFTPAEDESDLPF